MRLSAAAPPEPEWEAVPTGDGALPLVGWLCGR